MQDDALTQSIRSFFLSKVSKDDGKLKQLFNSPFRCGWLLNERLINMPWQLSAPMLRILQDEIATMVVEENSAHKPFVDFVILLCPVFQSTTLDTKDALFEGNEDENHNKQLSKKRKIRAMLKGKNGAPASKSKAKQSEAELTSFVHLEEEYFSQV
jgi:hypothetical protein